MIEDVQANSYLWRLDGASRSSVFKDLLTQVRDYSPTILIVQHPAGTGLLHAEWEQVRDAGNFQMIYHEGDAYDNFRKRVPPEFRATAAAADVSFSVGASHQLRLLQAAGSKDARWTPSVFNPRVFGVRKIAKRRDLDIVMIANESSSRLPFKSIPGSRRRSELVRALTQRFGKRFAVYGRGWRGPSARGPLDYSDQEEAIQSAWISTGWDHYTAESKFFSDRLPIALASGTVHVTSSHPGYSDIFAKDLGFIYHERSVRHIVKRIERLFSSCDDGAFIREMTQGRQFAQTYFRQDDNFVGLLNAGGASINVTEAKAAWNLEIEPISQL